MNNNIRNIDNIPLFLRNYLKIIGFDNELSVDRFLFPRLEDLPNPSNMLNVTEAARVVVEHMREKKQIVLWGDYDVDGTTGTALLINFFDQLGVPVRWHVPDRFVEGYGVNAEWFQCNKETFTTKEFLLITIDCGISNQAEIANIQKLGGTVIVTDHHKLREHAVPDCLIVNPSFPLCGFHEEHLAGVGVVFYLVAGIRAELCGVKQFSEIASRINLKQYLAFVALGTIADMVPLTPTNRILVRAGAEALSDTGFVGLQELLSSCGIEEEEVLSEDISFLIGPKINAAGRLGVSELPVELFIQKERAPAKKMAARLTQLNDERKRICSENIEFILTTVSAHQVLEKHCVIIQGNCHQGVSGIVASKLVEVYGFPAVVFSEKKQIDNSSVYVGSARSVEHINLMEVLQECDAHIIKFGGHEMAAGLTVSSSSLQLFSDTFSERVKERWKGRKLTQKRTFDLECPVDDSMTEEFLEFMKLLEPFGNGNSQPIFLDKNARVVDSKIVGKTEEHLQVTIRGKLTNLKGIGFFMADRIKEVQRNPNRPIAYSITVNRYRGNTSRQLRVIDI